MEAKIISQIEAPHLKRKHVTVDIHYEGTTPSKLLLRTKVADLAKAKEELVCLRKVDCVYGATKARIDAYVYSDAEVMKNVEQKHFDKRIAKLEEKNKKVKEAKEKAATEAKAAAETAKAEAAEAKADAPAEEAKADAPAEEKLSEKKSE